MYIGFTNKEHFYKNIYFKIKMNNLILAYYIHFFITTVKYNLTLRYYPKISLDSLKKITMVLGYAVMVLLLLLELD